MKKLVLILSFVFAFGLVSVDAMSNKKVANNQPVKTEQTAKKAVEKPAVKKAVKRHKTTKKAQTTVKK